jgi:hypothetical protein
MPDLIGHRILRGFEELYYAVPTFVGMTGKSVCLFKQLDEARVSTCTFNRSV